MSKLKRQGLIVTIEQLRRIADKLEKQLLDLYLGEHNVQLEIKPVRFQIGIINKKGLSDTWEIQE